MEAICVIPARGGSKGIPKKNLQRIGGRSLLEITISKAKLADCFKEIVVSTDCEEIAEEAHRAGVWVMDQPGASDDSMPESAEEYVISQMTGFDIIARLFCTSPFRSTYDVFEPIRMIRTGEAAAVVSVTAPAHYPSQHVRVSGHGFYAGHMSRVWRQPRQYWDDMRVLNGAVYAATTEHHKRFGFFSEATKLYEMPQGRSFDIDTVADLEEARRMYDLRFRS